MKELFLRAIFVLQLNTNIQPTPVLYAFGIIPFDIRTLLQVLWLAKIGLSIM
jgi:hypothetical protein